MTERFKAIGLRWLELCDQTAVRPSVEAFCEGILPGPENAHDRMQCLRFLADIDRFDANLDRLLSHDDNAVPSIPGYALLDQIASGGMGIIWRANDLRLNRIVAVKVMKSSIKSLPGAAEDFHQEAQLTARLAHPNLVPIHELGIAEDGRAYYVMKLVDGQTLAQRLASYKSVVQHRTELLKIFSQICQGVAFAHRQGILHFDLKPENVMVGRLGEVQVMDWGLARELPQSGRPSTRRYPRAIGGTPGYMSPEQALGSDLIDQRSDVYALGAILAVLLTGNCPSGFSSNTTPDDAKQLQAALSDVGVDSRLSRLALKCMSRDPRDRLGDAAEVGAALDDYLYGVERENQRRQLWRKLALTSAMFVVVLACGLYQLQSLWRAADSSRQRSRRILDEWSLSVVDEWLELRPDELTPERRDLMERMQSHYNQLLAESGQSAEVRAACANGLRRVGQMRVINSDYSGASQPLQTARDLMESLIRENPEHPALLADLAYVCHVQGAMLDSQQPPDFAQAHVAYQVAIELLEQLCDRAPASAYSRRLARSLISQAWVLRSLRQHDSGLNLIQRAISLLETVIADNPNEWLPHEDLASGLNVRYFLHSDRGDIAAAGQSLRRAIETRESLAVIRPDFQKNTIRLAINYGNFGKFLHVQGSIQEAHGYYNQAISILQPILKRNPDLPECRNTLRNVHTRRAFAAEQLGDVPAAMDDWQVAASLETSPTRCTLLHARLALAQSRPLETISLIQPLTQLGTLNSEDLFDLGRVLARVSVQLDDAALRAELESQAIELLQRAMARGYQVLFPQDPCLNSDLGHLAQRPEIQRLFTDPHSDAQ